ncbi:hypothetical protein T09_12388 [Trichinella sp. T9]|nr:hypothetical protein T09_12388 [Trichinella sp. T9]
MIKRPHSVGYTHRTDPNGSPRSASEDPTNENSLSGCSARSNDLDHRSNSKRKANGKLPELKMPVFLDKVLEFPTFWDRFQACVHRRTDLDDASKFAWRMAPMEAFSSEFQALSRKGRVVATSRLSWLDSFVDEEGFLRVGGRLENSELSTHMKHPVILPGDHAYAGSSETAILGAVGTHPSEEGNLELFCLPACNGQTNPAENSGLPSSRGRSRCIRPHWDGLCGAIVRPRWKESHFQVLRVPVHIHGIPGCAPGAGLAVDDCQSDASAPAVHCPARKTEDYAVG